MIKKTKKIIILSFLFIFYGIAFAAENQDKGNTGNSIDNNILWGGHFLDFLVKLFIAFVVVILLILLSKLIASSIKKAIIKRSMISDDEYVAKMGNLVGDVVFYMLLIFDVIIGFQIIGLDLGLLLGGLSFGLGFAFKEILGNMISGILILTTKDYTLGDLIKIEGDTGNVLYFGYIEEITIRYTVLREFNNQKVIIPNLTFITSAIKPYTTEEYIRLETKVLVHYGSNIKKVKDIIINAINEQKFILNKEYTDVITESFGDNGIELNVRFYIDPNGNVGPMHAIGYINDVINNAFNKEGIVIPYPHTTITVDKNDQNLLKTLLFIKK